MQKGREHLHYNLSEHLETLRRFILMLLLRERPHCFVARDRDTHREHNIVVVEMVEALCCKPEGHGIDSR
jgi:hypothetical protein